MTESYRPVPAPTEPRFTAPGSGTPEYAAPDATASDSTAQAVKQEAANVGQTATQAGGRVAQTAVDQGREVVRETRAQARNLVNEATSELSHQASQQQKRAAEGLRAVGSELHAMAGRSEQGGLASELVAQAADRAHQAAHWLEHRQPGDVVQEVRDLARRHPGAFLAGAVVAGVVVGRLTRNLASGGTDNEQHYASDTYYEKAQVPTQRVVTEPLPPVSEPYATATESYATPGQPYATPGTESYPTTGEYGVRP